LMDSRKYIQEIEKFYREIWKNFCNTKPKQKSFRTKNF